MPVDQQVIADQLEATTAAYGAASGAPSVLDTVKIGMLGSPATISKPLPRRWPRGGFTNVVLDPVLICKGQEPGHALDTDQALKAQILPLATFVTPNHFEAESLSGLEITDVESLKAAAIRIHELSGAAVLAKGGVRLAGPDAVDVYYDGDTLEVLCAPKVGEVAVSGAGCSLAAAVTAELAKGATPLEAARTAKAFVTAGIRNRVASGAPFDALWQGGAALTRRTRLSFPRPGASRSERRAAPGTSGAGVGHRSHEQRQAGFDVDDLVVERPVEVDGPLGLRRSAGGHAVDLGDRGGDGALFGNCDVGSLRGLGDHHLGLDVVEVLGGAERLLQAERLKHLAQVKTALVVPAGQLDLHCFGAAVSKVSGDLRELGRVESRRRRAGPALRSATASGRTSRMTKPSA